MNEIDLFEIEIFRANSDTRDLYMPKYNEYMEVKKKFEREIIQIESQNKKSPHNQLFDEKTIERNQQIPLQ